MMFLLEKYNVQNKLHNYLRLIRFDKPVGTILLMWPALWGLWLANQGAPDFKILIIFLLGVFLMRSAGCIINDLADRNIDGGVARTKSRPLVTSRLDYKVTIKEAIILLFSLCFLAFLLVLSLNNLDLIYHSFVALLLASIYPFCKRFFACPQFVLGMAFGYAIPMAYVASGAELSNLTWYLFILSILHSIIYDSFYAMADREDDLQLGLKSSAILFRKLAGNRDILIVAFIQLVFIVDLVYIMYLLYMDLVIILVTAVLVIILFSYQIYLARSHLNNCYLTAFKNNNWVGCIIFISFLLGL